MSPGTDKGDGGQGGLQCTAKVTILFLDEAACARAQAALAPESSGFLELEKDGKRLHIKAPAGTVNRVLATLDDALGCLQAAEGTQAASASSSQDAQPL